MIIRCWACLLPLLVLGCSTQILAGSRRCSTYILFVRLASHLASACTICQDFFFQEFILK
jgi:hypothetical protein